MRSLSRPRWVTAAAFSILAGVLAGAGVSVGGHEFAALLIGITLLGAGVAVFARHRIRRGGYPRELSTEPPPNHLIWSIRLFLPLMSMAALTFGLSIAALLVIAGNSSLRSFRAGPVSPMGWIGPLTVLALVAVSGMAWIGGLAVTGTISGARFLVLAASAVSAIAIVVAILRSNSRGTAFAVATIDSLAIYTLASVCAYFVLGIQSGTEEVRVSGATSISGLGSRITFPLSYALSTPPLLSAAFLVAALTVIGQVTHGRRLFYLVAAGAAVTILVLANNRVPLGLVAVVGLAVLLAPRLLTAAAPALACIALLLPFWWNTTQSVVVPFLEWLGNAAGVFDRGLDDQYVTLQYRTHLWDALFAGVSHANPAELIFGHGAIGQRPSGLAAAWAPYFTNFQDPLSGTAHNSLLQQFIDSGLLGAGVLFGAVLLAGWTLRQAVERARGPYHRASYLAVLALYVVLAGGGSAEVALSTGSTSEVAWLIPILLAIGIAYTRNDQARLNELASGRRSYSDPEAQLTPKHRRSFAH